MLKNIVPKIVVLIVLFYIAFTNLMVYLPYKDNSLAEREKNVLQKVNQGRRIEFQVGVPDSYLYYYYMRQKGIDPYGI
jgi:hypothetical protein